MRLYRRCAIFVIAQNHDRISAHVILNGLSGYVILLWRPSTDISVDIISGWTSKNLLFGCCYLLHSGTCPCECYLCLATLAYCAMEQTTSLSPGTSSTFPMWKHQTATQRTTVWVTLPPKTDCFKCTWKRWSPKVVYLRCSVSAVSWWTRYSELWDSGIGPMKLTNGYILAWHSSKSKILFTMLLTKPFLRALTTTSGIEPYFQLNFIWSGQILRAGDQWTAFQWTACSLIARPWI